MSLTPVIPTKHSWYYFFKLPQIRQFGLKEHFCRRGKHKLLPFVLRRKDKIEIPLRKDKQSGYLVYMIRLAPIMLGLSWPAIWWLKTDVYVYWKIRSPFIGLVSVIDTEWPIKIINHIVDALSDATRSFRIAWVETKLNDFGKNLGFYILFYFFPFCFGIFLIFCIKKENSPFCVFDCFVIPSLLPPFLMRLII